MNRNTSFQRRFGGNNSNTSQQQQQQQDDSNNHIMRASIAPGAGGSGANNSNTNNASPKSPNTNNNITNRAIAQDHDDEAEDQVIARNPRDWPFPCFDPAGDVASLRQKDKLKIAKKAMKELIQAPAVVAIQAPLETDRPPWKAAITLQRTDPTPLDLRSEKPKKGTEEFLCGSSPNAYLLDQSRPRWVSIAQTKIVSGCPSRGIPLQEQEPPSARAQRRHEEKRLRSLHSGRSVSGSQHHHSPSSTARSATSTATGNPHISITNPDEKKYDLKDPSARSLRKLLNNMDSQAAGTRSHMPREEKVLNFLRESTRAQGKIKQMIFDPDNADQIPVEEFASSTMFRKNRFLNQQQQQQQERQQLEEEEHNKKKRNDDDDDDENGLQVTFEELTQPKTESLSQSLAQFHSVRPDFSKSSNANASTNNNNNKSVRFPDIHNSSHHNQNQNLSKSSMMMSSARRKSVMDIAREVDQVYHSAKRSFRGGDFVPSQSHRDHQQHKPSNRKILVRLPKVGLQLFSAS